MGRTRVSLYGQNGKVAQVHQRERDRGLVVFTAPLSDYEFLFAPALNDIHGAEMAIDAGFTGVADKVHDGTDNTLWAATSISGTKFTFNATPPTPSPVTGLLAVESANPGINDVMQFDKGSDIDLSTYVGVTMYIYVTSNWVEADNISIYGWDVGTGMQVGNKVLLDSYFQEQDFGTWHKLSIPLGDMGLAGSTIDAFRIEIEAKSGPSPTWYLDDLQVEKAGGTIEFKVEAPRGKIFLVDNFRFSFVDGYDATLLNSNMPNISYNKILGLDALTNGIGFANTRKGVVRFSASIKTVGDSLKGGGNITNPISDGTNTCITLETPLPAPVVLDSRFEDKISITINDDLSDLISFSALAIGRIEDINPEEQKE